MLGPRTSTYACASLQVTEEAMALKEALLIKGKLEKAEVSQTTAKGAAAPPAAVPTDIAELVLGALAEKSAADAWALLHAEPAAKPGAKPAAKPAGEGTLAKTLLLYGTPHTTWQQCLYWDC